MDHMPPKDHPDPTLPIAMGIFAAFVIVTFFGMLITGTHIALRPTFNPTAPTAVSTPG
jgi:hypothetical protein